MFGVLVPAEDESGRFGRQWSSLAFEQVKI
jgi:hypothetical protein